MFSWNRLKDILQMYIGLEFKYGHKPLFRYVATIWNLADLIPSGLTLKKFRSNFEFGVMALPSYTRGSFRNRRKTCLNNRCRQLARSSVSFSVVLGEEYPSVLPLQRFSTFTRLLRVISLVFKLVAMLR